MISLQACSVLMAVYSAKANLSPAIVTSLQTINPFITAVLFYMIYDEKLMKKHVLGMFCILLCVVFIALSKYFDTNMV